MFRPTVRNARLAIAACAVLLPAGSALASQGPGGGMGTASSLTQIAMAVIVYGASALLIGTGLIGAMRRR
jgi:N-acetylglutamate synthase/N-acetylornithine aminotransferase